MLFCAAVVTPAVVFVAAVVLVVNAGVQVYSQKNNVIQAC